MQRMVTKGYRKGVYERVTKGMGVEGSGVKRFKSQHGPRAKPWYSGENTA